MTAATSDAEVLVGYRAALESAALYDEGARGRLLLRERDRAALLHRLSTNDIEALRPGQGTRSVLTNHNGRIIDLLTVYALDDRLLAVTSPGQRGAVRGLLRKNIFFNDKVVLEDSSTALSQLSLYGPASAELLADLGAPAARDLPLHASAAVQLAGSACIVARALPLGGAGWTIMVPAEERDALVAALTAAGAHTLDAAAYDILRVEAGYGAFGRELSLEYIPLETGLSDAISFTKGCYVGQEIIARMDSRGRMAKQLRGLKLSAEYQVLSAESEAEPSALSTQHSAPLAKLTVDGKESGDLTSAVLSPRFGPIALAYVRSAHAAPGSVVGIAGSAVTGEVVALPF